MRQGTDGGVKGHLFGRAVRKMMLLGEITDRHIQEFGKGGGTFLLCLELIDIKYLDLGIRLAGISVERGKSLYRIRPAD